MKSKNNKELEAKINIFVEYVEKLKEEMTEKGSVLFTELSNSFFERYPKLEKFSWMQYTVYFNDGDECHFGVRSYTLCINDDESEEDYEMSYEGDDESWKNDASEELRSFIDNFPEEILMDLFGDHAKVIVTKTGVEVEEYTEHD